MVVGARKWSVRREGTHSIRITTSAWEQRNNWCTELGFELLGKNDMAKVWATYLTNIGMATTKGVKGAKYALVETIWCEEASDSLGNRYRDDVEKLMRK
jgi:hypothetical protein